MESELEVHEFSTKFGHALSVNLPKGSKRAMVLPFSQQIVSLTELTSVGDEMEAQGYACAVNFQHETMVCVK